jgi:hypothetical protein
MSTSVLQSRLEMPGAAHEACEATDQPAIQIAETREDRRSSFELVYHAYRRANLCESNPFGVRITPHQLLSSTDIFTAKVHGETISTLSLVTDSELGLPLEGVFPWEVEERRRLGLAIGEVSCLADRRSDMKRFCSVVVGLIRHMVQSARYRKLDQLLIAVHPRHARFYERYLAFDRISDERSYPSVCEHRAVALSLDFSMIDRHRAGDYQRFIGTPLSEDQVQPRPISEADRKFFEPMSIAALHAEPLGNDRPESPDPCDARLCC